MQHNPPQGFREDIRLIGANETSNVSAIKINAAGTIMKINDESVPLTVDGAVTFTETVAHSGGVYTPVETQAGETDTLVAADSGKVIICTRTSTTQTFTLPSAAVAGLMFTFVTTSAASEVKINPITGQTIQTKATVDQGASVAPAAGTGIKNTAATNVVGDFITLISDGTTGWVTIAQSGIWASQ